VNFFGLQSVMMYIKSAVKPCHIQLVLLLQQYDKTYQNQSYSYRSNVMGKMHGNNSYIE